MIFWQYPLPILQLANLLIRHHRLKSFNTPGHTVYTIDQINVYPLGIYSLQIVTSMYRFSTRKQSADLDAKP